MHAGCVFVAGIYPSRTWIIDGCVFVANIYVLDMNYRVFWVLTMQYICAQTRPRFILSFKCFGGMESESMWTPRENSPLPGAQRRVEPTAQHLTGQRAQHSADWAIPAAYTCFMLAAQIVYRTRYVCAVSSVPFPKNISMSCSEEVLIFISLDSQ